MSFTAPKHDQHELMADAAPRLARQLWLIWARETDGLVKRLEADGEDDAWREHVQLLEDAASEMGARKVGTVARKARAMTGERTAERQTAIQALRVAARLDLEAGAPR